MSENVKPVSDVPVIEVLEDCFNLLRHTCEPTSECNTCEVKRRIGRAIIVLSDMKDENDNLKASLSELKAEHAASEMILELKKCRESGLL